MNHEVFNWQTRGNLKIFAKIWHSHLTPKGILLLIHGLGEHIERYNHFAAFYNNNNFTVASFDLIGHGKSDGIRGHVPSLVTYLDDIHQFLVEITTKLPNLPIFLYGHSLGGNLLLNFILKTNKLSFEVVGAIASASFIALDPAPPKALLTFARLASRFFPTISQNNRLILSGLSRDTRVVDAYKADKLVHSQITISAATATIGGANWLLRYKGNFPLPLLIMHGSKDILTSPTGSIAFFNNITGKKTLKIWENLYHELHNEPEKQEVFIYTLLWMNNILSKKII